MLINITITCHNNNNLCSLCLDVTYCTLRVWSERRLTSEGVGGVGGGWRETGALAYSLLHPYTRSATSTYLYLVHLRLCICTWYIYVYVFVPGTSLQRSTQCSQRYIFVHTSYLKYYYSCQIRICYLSARDKYIIIARYKYMYLYLPGNHF